MKLIAFCLLLFTVSLQAANITTTTLPVKDSIIKSVKSDPTKTRPVTETQVKNLSEPEMVRIPGGFFSMGAKEGDQDERPVHRVVISSFKMGKYEITMKEFAAFISSTNYQTDAEKQGNSYVYIGHFDKADGVSWRDDEEGHHRSDSDASKPVVHVSWNDANAYCQWLSRQTGKTFRLPTDAEWEYAAGCGMKHYKYSWGNFMPRTGNGEKPVANVADETNHPKYGALLQKYLGYKDGFFFAAPVGSFMANEFGLYDMTGNVFEWCNDWYDPNYYANSPENNPQGPSTGKFRIMRGGSWYFNVINSRIAYRIPNIPERRHSDLGFRIAQTL